MEKRELECNQGDIARVSIATTSSVVQIDEQQNSHQDMALAVQQLRMMLEAGNLTPGAPSIIQIGDNNSVEFREHPPTFDHLDTTSNIVVSVLKALTPSQSLISELYLDLELKLKTIYKKLKPPKLPWLTEEMSMDFERFYMELQMDVDKSPVQLEEIFTKHRKTRILIEAPPGYGKTSLCTKILYDWAMERPYTTQYKLAFRVILRNMPKKQLDDAMAMITTRFGIDGPILQEIIKSIEDQVLIILDGFDELPDEKKELLFPVLFKQMYPKATVLMTVRTGEYNINTQDTERVLGEPELDCEFQDVTYNILGVNSDNVIDFIVNVTKISTKSIDIEELKRKINTFSDLFKCPLFVILLTFICQQNDIVEELYTKTKLFKALFNCIIRRSLSRDNKKPHYNIDIFDMKNQYSKVYQLKIKKFGEEALTRIEASNLQFEFNELNHEIYLLGFLIKHKEKFFYSTSTHFEAFHLTILEFAAAYSLWYKICSNNFILEQTVLKSLNHLFLQYLRSKKGQLLWKFFFGLSGNHFISVMDQLRPYSHLYGIQLNRLSTFSFPIYELLKDVQVPLLPHFMPTSCNATLDSGVMKMAVDCGRLQSITCLFCKNILSLPSNVLIPELHLNFHEFDNVPFNPVLMENVRCSKLIVRVDINRNNVSILGVMKLVLSCVSCNICELIWLRPRSAKTMNECLPANLKIDSLTFCLAGTEFEDLQEFVNLHKVKRLQLTRVGFSNKFLAISRQFPLLQQLQIDYECTRFGICFPPVNAVEGEEKWSVLRNFMLTKTKSANLQTIESLVCTNQEDEDLINLTTHLLGKHCVSVLHVSVGNLNIILDNYLKLFKSIVNIEKLILEFGAKNFDIIWKKMFECISIQQLILIENLAHLVDENNVGSLVMFLKSRSIEYLYFQSTGSGGRPFTNLLKSPEFHRFCFDRTLKRIAIASSFNILLDDFLDEAVPCFLQCVLLDSSLTLEIICSSQQWFQILSLGVVDLTVYSVTQSAVKDHVYSYLKNAYALEESHFSCNQVFVYCVKLM